MRIVFFGTPELAVPSLAALARTHEIAAVVCQPDRPSGRGKSLTPPPAKRWAVDHGIPVHQPAKLNDGAFETWLRGQKPDICALTAYGRILKQPIIDVAPHGILNMHPSLLPKYRGPSPIQSALMNGETETGVTIMRLSLEMDAGDILLQERIGIAPEDNGETLTRRLADLGGELLRGAVDMVASGTAKFTPQDHTRATYCRLIQKRDGQIDWSKPAREIHNLVRGARPWPTAHCVFEGETIRILRTELRSNQSAMPHPPDNPALSDPPKGPAGSIVRVETDRLIVSTGQGTLDILEIQTPGKRAMPVSDFLRGHSIRAGQRFESLS